MLRETTIRTKVGCITSKLGNENSIYPVESRKEEKDNWVKKDFQCGFCIGVEKYTVWSWVTVAQEKWNWGSQQNWESKALGDMPAWIPLPEMRNFILLWDFCCWNLPFSILFIKSYNFWGIIKLTDFTREGYMESTIFRGVLSHS